MAYALSLRHSCSRYLSPSRASSPACALGIQTDPSSCYNSQQQPNTGLGAAGPRQSQGYHTCKSVHPKTLQSNQLATISSSPVCSHQRSLSDLRNKLNYMDMSAFLKVFGNLNLDLPQMFNVHRLLFWRQKLNPQNVQSTHEVKSSSCQMKSPSESVKISSAFNENNMYHQELSENTQSPPFVQPTTHNIQRDKHNFEKAMLEQETCVRNYCSNAETHSEESRAYAYSESTTSPNDATSQPTSRMEATANMMRQLTSYLPGFSNGPSSPKAGSDRKAKLKKPVTPRGVVERKTKGLVRALRIASSSSSQLIRMEELCSHLAKHPDAKGAAVKEKVIPCLLHLRKSRDAAMREEARKALALVGFVDPVKRRGIRILSLDGGGTRGLVAIEILRRLEETCKMPVYKMFDMICGVSTGSLIGIMLAHHKVSLDEAERLYKTFSTEIFQRYKLMGVSKLVVSHGYYDAQLWEKILRENIGLDTFMDAMKQEDTPKIASISTLMNMMKLSNFLFRNYDYPSGVQSQLPGSCRYAFWQAIRASSAAPGYYQEYKLDEWIHQDGGIITNNPTAIAIHEAKRLWPNDSLQCVVSIGTGRYEPTLEPELTSSSLRNKVNKIIQSATDTEAVHTTLHDLLPPSTYFRFNPYMSEDFHLDEIRPDRWNQMTIDTQLYCRKNEHKIKKATDHLVLSKLPQQKVADWVKMKSWELS